MSNVSGVISVSVEFRDSTTLASVERLKTIALRETTEYTTGKVAIITGTAGTAAVVVGEIGITPYRDASGAEVEFTTVRRVAFSWSGTSLRELTDTMLNPSPIKLVSSNSSVAVSGFENGSPSISPVISSGSGTGTYTIVLYGE